MILSKSKIYELKLFISREKISEKIIKKFAREKNLKIVDFSIKRLYINDLFILACKYGEIDLLEYCLSFDLDKLFIYSCIKLCKNVKIQKIVLRT